MSEWERVARQRVVALAILRRAGYSHRKQSNTGSLYVFHPRTGRGIRVSNHYIPLTPEREAWARQGRWTWAIAPTVLIGPQQTLRKVRRQAREAVRAADHSGMRACQRHREKVGKW